MKPWLNRMMRLPNNEPHGRKSATERAASTRQDAGGFTLVEILVVIAVIGILAALLLPALSKTSKKSLQTYCVSNQRQIAIALGLYTSDNADVLPRLADWNTLGGQDGAYDFFVAATNRALFAYQGNGRIFHCPADRGDAFVAHPTPPGATCWSVFGNSYLVEWLLTFLVSNTPLAM